MMFYFHKCRLAIKVSHLLDYSCQIDLQISNVGRLSSEIKTSAQP